MLHPPLSLFSDDLLFSIVEHVAKLPSKDEDLHNLSLADRAFTKSCQKYIFRDLKFGKGDISKALKQVKRILDDNPSFANQIRMVEFIITGRWLWLFNEPTFINILQLLSKSPMPPHEFHLGGHRYSWFVIEDPTFVVQQLARSFFSQTLTILRLTECPNVPSSLFLICPRLREVFLDHVGPTGNRYDNYPDDQCSGREAPRVEVFDCRNSSSLVKRMIAPPPRFKTPVVIWSNLRVLKLISRQGMACLQPILDAACNTLEELYLDETDRGKCRCSIYFDNTKRH